MNKVLKFTILWASYSLIISLFVFLWLFKSKIAVYGTNDDELMASILNGRYGQNFQQNLVFIQPFITYPLSFLQNNFPNVNVYSIFLLITVIICYSAIFTSLTLFKPFIIKLIVIFFFTLYGITFISWFAINPTYTGASIFAISTAVYFLIDTIAIKNHNNVLNFVLTNVFFIFGFFIRKESIYIFLLLSLPLVSLYLYRNKFKNLQIKKYIISIFFILILILLNLFLYKNTYKGAEWKEYIQMNEVRHEIQSRAPERFLPQYLTEMNWTDETYQLFKRFSLLDRSEMNTINMKNVLNLTKDYVGIKTLITTPIFPNLKNLFHAFQIWNWILILIVVNLILFLFVLILTHSNYKNFFIDTCFFLIPITIGLVILSSGFQLPERITFNFLAGLVPILFLLFYYNLRLLSLKINMLNSLFLILISLLISYFYLNRFVLELNARQNLYQSRMINSINQQKTLLKFNNGKILIGSASVFRNDWRFPYKSFKEFDQNKQLIILGWHNLSPLWIQKTKDMQIDGNNFPNEYFNPRLIYVDSYENILILKKYLEYKKYQFDVEEIGILDSTEFRFYKFKLN